MGWARRRRSRGQQLLVQLRWKFSQSEIAKRVGVAQSTVSGWADGKFKPEGSHPEALERSFGIPQGAWALPPAPRVRSVAAEPRSGGRGTGRARPEGSAEPAAAGEHVSAHRGRRRRPAGRPPKASAPNEAHLGLPPAAMGGTADADTPGPTCEDEQPRRRPGRPGRRGHSAGMAGCAPSTSRHDAPAVDDAASPDSRSTRGRP